MSEQWENIKLKDISKIEYGKSPSSIRVDSSDYPIYGTSGQVGYAKSSLFKAPLILIGRKGTIDKPFYIDKDCWIIDTAYGLSVDNKSVDLKWLYYFLSNFDLAKLNEATGVPSLNRENLYNIKMPLPPRKEQQKMASILSSVDKAIEKTEAIVEKTEKVKKGLMQQLFTKGIGHIKFKNTSIGEIPYDWELVKVSDLTLEHKQGYYTKDKYVEDGVYLIRITDLKNPKIDFSTMPKLDMDGSIYEQFKVEKDDFLFARSGASIGRYGIVTEKDPKAVFASYLIRFKFNNQYVDNRYFGYFYESDACWKQIKSIIQGSSNPNINANNIKNLEIALPSLVEQKHIVDILSSVDEKIYINKLKLQEFQTLKEGLMQSLLTGKVRVKIDEAEVTQV